MFNLQRAIEEWRQGLRNAGIQDADALDELESHLRESIDQQLRAGEVAAQAFATAVRGMGTSAALKEEFMKTGEPKQTFFRRMQQFLCRRAGGPALEPDEWAMTAQQTLDLAPQAARRFHHDFIGTEHVLLSLLEVRCGLVATVMRRLGVEAETVRLEIERVVGCGQAHDSGKNIPMTPRAKKALQLAAAEARTLNQPRIHAEHIFLGLILEGSGVAALVLKNLGIRPDNAREELLREMRAHPGAD